MPGPGFRNLSVREPIAEQVERFMASDPCSTYSTFADACQGLIREALAEHRTRHSLERAQAIALGKTDADKKRGRP